MNILVLYTRLTDYWMSCMAYDHRERGNNYLVCVKTPSADAPFKLESQASITLLNEETLSYDELQVKVDLFQPELIYVSGWTNKKYLKLCRLYKSQSVPVIVGMDNHWLGTPKQILASLLSRWLVLPYFTHIWVPGNLQYVYARKLGFSDHRILTGLYCADCQKFGTISQTRFQRQLLFIGRIVAHKGVNSLFEVINRFINSDTFNFTVHIIGNGPLKNVMPQHSGIKHSSFVHPSEMPAFLENAGFFILPSTYEAWGVVIHEAVLAGLPVITTYQCGAGTELVIDGYNGFLYDASDTTALAQIIEKAMGMSESAYLQMSANSKLIAHRVNQGAWSAKLNAVVSF